VLYRRGNLDGTFDDLICEALIDHYDADFAFSPGFRWGRTILPGPITVDDVYSQTALTYPNTYKTKIKGSALKDVMEDIGDNIFNPDPYKQQGGDMVRTAGMSFTIKVNEKIGNRIQNLKIRGKDVHPDKEYTMTAWASVQEQPGPPVYDVVINYIKKKKTINVKHDRPKMIY
jgi:sulfur-oxidizing protein SoxB